MAALGLGGFGESPIFYSQGGDPYQHAGGPEPLIGLQSFSLRPIPEPATWGLLAIGGLSIVFAMRRRGRPELALNTVASNDQWMPVLTRAGQTSRVVLGDDRRNQQRKLEWVLAFDLFKVATRSFAVAPGRTWNLFAAPVNENSTNRIRLAGNVISMAGDNTYATEEPNEPTEGIRSIWWTWIAPTSGTYTVTATAGNLARALRVHWV